eukprot:1581635-Alexandrium_andersonii.AAC.1
MRRAPPTRSSQRPLVCHPAWSSLATPRFSCGMIGPTGRRHLPRAGSLRHARRLLPVTVAALAVLAATTP